MLYQPLANVDMDAIAATAAYVAQNTLVVPAFLAYLIAPRISLKTWLAVQQLDNAPEHKGGKFKKFIMAFVLLAFVGTEVFVLAKGSEQLIESFFRIVCGIMFQSALLMFFSHAFKTNKWSVHRSGSRNLLTFRMVRGSASVPRMILAVIAATGVNVGAYFYPSTTFGTVVSVALLTRFLSQAPARTLSIRLTMIALLSWLALTFVFSAALIMLLIKTKALEDAPEMTEPAEGEYRIAMMPQGSQPTEDMNMISDNVMEYMNLLVTALWAAGPGFLIAACYRFDYAQHLTVSATAVPTLETVDAPTSRCSRAAGLTRGVIVPSFAPRGHRKPYFATALLAWLGSQAVITALFHFTTISQAALETRMFDILGLSLSIPVMVLSLVLTAVLRGEMKSLWRHQEEWAPKRSVEGAVALGEDDEEEAQVGSPVVAYADLDNKVEEVEEEAPAYVDVSPAPAYDVKA